MKTVSNAFLTQRQMGEAEAVYKLIPSMTLKQSNIACQWVSLGRQEERSKRWKKATEEELKTDRQLIKLKDHEGLWYEQQDMWSKYLRRPTALENMCFAQFAKMYTSCHQTVSNEEYQDEEDDVVTAEDRESIAVDDKFNYMMTHRTDGMGKRLPEHIILNDPYPGEPQIMRKRQNPAVLRFNKSNHGNNPMKYMLSELMLCRPVTAEIEHDEIEGLYEELHQGKCKIEIVKSQVMENLEGVE